MKNHLLYIATCLTFVQSAHAATSYEPGKGVTFATDDKEYSIRLRGYTQLQWREQVSQSGESQTLARSARPIIDAKLSNYVSARFMWDVAGYDDKLLDAYVDLKPADDAFILRVGKFKIPIGLERWQTEQELLFAERGQTTNLVPFRDVGVMALGKLADKKLEYQLAYLYGANDLAINSADSDAQKDVAARLFWHSPYKLSFGLAGTYGEHYGNNSSRELVRGYATMGQTRYFAYSSASRADGTQWRLNPHAYYYNGPFSLLGEYVINAQEIRSGSNQRTLRNDAWSAITTYVLTGEDASFDGVKPAQNFSPTSGQWGAFELTARAGQLHVDKDAFGAFANSNTASRQASEGALGINWYLNQMVKLNVDYARTIFEGGATGGRDRESEDVLLTQVQLRF